MANSKAGKVIGKAIVLILKAIFYIHLVYIVFTSTLIFTYKFINPPYTVLMTYRALGYGWKLEKPILISIKKVPPYVKTMLVPWKMESSTNTTGSTWMPLSVRGRLTNGLVSRFMAALR